MTNTTICTHPNIYNQDNIASLGLLVYCVADHVYNHGIMETGIEIIFGMFAYMIFTCVGYTTFLIMFPLIDLFNKSR